MGGGVITPPYNGWYETYEFKFDDQLIKADNLNWCLKVRIKKTLSLRASAHTGVAIPRLEGKCTEKHPEE